MMENIRIALPDDRGGITEPMDMPDTQLQGDKTMEHVMPGGMTMPQQ